MLAPWSGSADPEEERPELVRFLMQKGADAGMKDTASQMTPAKLADKSGCAPRERARRNRSAHEA